MYRNHIRYAALAGVLLALSARPTQAQAPAGDAAPKLDAETVRTVKSALQRAREAWGHAELVAGQPGSGASATLLTGEAALASAALVQAAGVVAASTLAVQVYMTRSGSIVQYGNPYGVPSKRIAFPILYPPTPPTFPQPYPIPKPPAKPKPGDDDKHEPRYGRIYCTYTRYNRKSGLYYSGRASAVIDLDKDWDIQAEAAVRERNKRRKHDENKEPKKPGFVDPVLDRYAVGYAVDYTQRYRDAAYVAIRGREQQLIDFHGARRAKQRGISPFVGGARSDTGSGEPLTENAIRGVARDNPNGEVFHLNANLHFGELAPYTGDK
jgi:hypothetical protein